jgi:hypothetical protein
MDGRNDIILTGADTEGWVGGYGTWKNDEEEGQDKLHNRGTIGGSIKGSVHWILQPRFRTKL